MSEVCNACEFKEECKELGFDMDVNDQDECEHFYGFSSEQLEAMDNNMPYVEEE